MTTVYILSVDYVNTYGKASWALSKAQRKYEYFVLSILYPINKRSRVLVIELFVDLR